MKYKTSIQRYLLQKATNRAKIEFGILIPAAIVGLVISLKYGMLRMPFVPFINIAGILLLIVSLWFHFYCEKMNTQAHDEPHEIEKLITDGIYSKVRHPINFSMIITNISIALISGSYIAVPIALFTCIILVLISKEEEKALTERFGEEYLQYLSKTKWKMIPGIY